MPLKVSEGISIFHNSELLALFHYNVKPSPFPSCGIQNETPLSNYHILPTYMPLKYKTMQNSEYPGSAF